MAEQDTLDNRVASEVFGLTGSIASIIRMAQEPQSRDLLALDYETLADAHQQLARVLNRLPVIRRRGGTC